MEQVSLPADAGEQQPEHRYVRYPSISTISRKAAAGTDVRQKIRYFRKLIIRLVGDIGERELLLRELRLDGEAEDAPRRELEIDRQLRFRRGDINDWIRASSQESLHSLMRAEQPFLS